MSFDVYVQCFNRHEHAGLPYSAVWRMFADFASRTEPDVWGIAYNRVNVCTIFVSRLESNRRRISGFMVNGPCSDRRLWHGLMQVMRMGHVVPYYPGGTAPLVANEATSQHLPVDMLETLGTPRIVRTGKAIREAIRND